MYTLHMKKWFHLAHLPDRHQLTTWTGHAIHDERFWPIVIASSLIVILIAFLVWAGLSGNFNVNSTPPRPPFPYGY